MSLFSKEYHNFLVNKKDISYFAFLSKLEDTAAIFCYLQRTHLSPSNYNMSSRLTRNCNSAKSGYEAGAI